MDGLHGVSNVDKDTQLGLPYRVMMSRLGDEVCNCGLSFVHLE